MKICGISLEKYCYEVISISFMVKPMLKQVETFFELTTINTGRSRTFTFQIAPSLKRMKPQRLVTMIFVYYAYIDA